MPQKTIAISGATGLVGSTLSTLAADRGWNVVPMVRRRDDDGIFYSVKEDAIDVEALEGVDAVVHLAGESIAGGRWTENKKSKILHSRTKSTELIAGAIESIADNADKPSVFVCASGSHYYGTPGDQWVDEDSEPGQGFLADVCRQWEAACEPARRTGCRVINTRFAMVLAKKGGALDKMLTPFKFGVGGRLGSGEQFMSWVDVYDLVRAILFVIDHDELEGPVNISAPNPVRNKRFTKALGDAINRPTLLPVPGPALKLAVGSEMAEEMLLSGQRVRPKRLLEAGFEFESTEIEEALNRVLS